MATLLPSTDFGLEGALREAIRGDVRFDAKTRLLYSTDASIHQILPRGVVLPRDLEDTRAAIAIAADAGVPILPRGGGTALAGQTVASALVLDFSRYMDRILDLDPGRGIARVEPGVRLDRLNRAAAAHGLQFGPDPATLRQCAIGGMIGNNACGARSVVYGKTGDHTRSVECVLPDGEVVRLGPLARKDLATPRDGDRRPSRERRLAREVLRLLEPERERIMERYPRVPRRVSGYNFDVLLGEEDVNLAKLIVGSEGTLATVTEAELGLVPLPARRGLVLLAFRDRFASMDAVPHILPSEPSALEIVDDRVLRGAREVLQYRESAALVGPDSQGVLFVEFTGADEAEVTEKAQRFAADAPRLPGEPTAGVYLDDAAQQRAWALRRAGLGLLYRSRGDVKPVPFVEDTGIPPERIGEYTRRFDEIIRRHGTTSGFFGHAGQGCLHIRVDLDLKVGGDVERMRAIAGDVAELVVEFGGSLSGEHGDGLSRSEFLPLLFGPEVMELHRGVKRIFDPAGLMNPGKIVDAPGMADNLRFGEDYRAEPPETFFDFSEDGGWDRAVEKCNGMAVCRKVDEGTMCPSYMVTREEEHSTRGRANALREAMRGRLDRTNSEEVLGALDLCLACKACKTECPVGVDMARYKAEYLAQYQQENGVPAASRVFGRIHRLAKVGSMAPRVANLGGRMFGGAMKRLAHVHPERELPRLASTPFRRGFGRSSAGSSGAAGGGVGGDADADGLDSSDPPGANRPRVILFDDTFHNYFEPGPLRAAATVLGRAGFDVELPASQVCCGRALISKGMLDEARTRQEALVDALAPAAAEGIPVVGIEPSCILTLRDELPDLVRGDARRAGARALAENSFTLEEFLGSLEDYRPGRLERRAVVHGHCHQKALVGMGPTRALLGRVGGLEFTVLDSGCCGMAGSFGYEESHYEVSRACGERVLFPAVRESADADLVIAPGFSCRTQISHFCEGRRALHPAEVLALAE